MRAWTLVEVTDATLRFDETVTLVPLLGDDPVLAFSGEGSVVVDRASGVPLVQESTWTWQERTSAGAVPREAHRTVSRQRGAR